MIALHPTNYCSRANTLDVVIEVRSEESIPDVVAAVEDSTEHQLDGSPFGLEKYERQFQDDDCHPEHQTSSTSLETTENHFRVVDRDLCQSGGASDSIDSGSSSGVSYDNLTHIRPEVTVDWPEKAQQYDRADSMSTALASPPSGTHSPAWVATFNENGQQPDDQLSMILGPTEGEVIHVTDALRTATSSTSHQLIVMGQLIVVVTSGVDTEKLIEDDD